MNRNAALALCLILLSLSACGDREAAPPESSEAPPASETPVGPISSRGQTVTEGASPTAGEGTIAFEVPASWQSQQPSSNMRVAQAVIPGSGGPGDLAVFYFGPGGGGTVEANLQRWADQMESTEALKPEAFESNGYRVTWIDVRGTLNPSQMGSGPTTPQPNSRLLGAVVEGPGGPWFFKATGPEATIAAEREAFLGMLRTVKAGG